LAEPADTRDTKAGSHCLLKVRCTKRKMDVMLLALHSLASHEDSVVAFNGIQLTVAA
jgi:hypothetical protein